MLWLGTARLGVVSQFRNDEPRQGEAGDGLVRQSSYV